MNVLTIFNATNDIAVHFKKQKRHVHRHEKALEIKTDMPQASNTKRSLLSSSCSCEQASRKKRDLKCAKSKKHSISTFGLPPMSDTQS